MESFQEVVKATENSFHHSENIIYVMKNPIGEFKGGQYRLNFWYGVMKNVPGISGMWNVCKKAKIHYLLYATMANDKWFEHAIHIRTTRLAIDLQSPQQFKTSLF